MGLVSGGSVGAVVGGSVGSVTDSAGTVVGGSVGSVTGSVGTVVGSVSLPPEVPSVGFGAGWVSSFSGFVSAGVSVSVLGVSSSLSFLPNTLEANPFTLLQKDCFSFFRNGQSDCLGRPVIVGWPRSSS